MKNLLYKLGCYLKIKYCPHKNTEIIYPDYQNRCYNLRCNDCGVELYEGMDYVS